jgi:hypothetical protein
MNVDQLDSYLINSGLPYEQIGDGTWVLRPESAHAAQIGIKISDPIILFSIQMFELSHDIKERERLFQTLLELNSELLHASYSLQGNQVVLSGAQQAENLDLNEFQAMVDDMCMALDNHYDRIAPLVAADTASRAAAAGAEGSA